MKFTRGLTCTAPLAHLLGRQEVSQPDQDEPELFPVEESGTNVLEGLGLGDIPEVGGGRPVRWNETNRLPRGCVEVVGEPGNVAGRCDLREMEVYDVEYDDCEGQPWTICRCPDADEDVAKLANDLGQLPVGARDYVRYVVMSAPMIIDESSLVEGAALYWTGDLIIYGNWSSVGLFVHESAHTLDYMVLGANDRSYSETQEWMDIVDADTCVADWYSKASYTEAYAQGAVLVAYDINDSGPLEDLVDYDCASNVHDTITEQLGEYLLYNSTKTCENRLRKTRDVCLKNNRVWAPCEDDLDDEDEEENEEENDDGSQTEDGENEDDNQEPTDGGEENNDDPEPTDDNEEEEEDNDDSGSTNNGGDDNNNGGDDNDNGDDESDASRPSALAVFKLLALSLRAVGLLHGQ